MNKKVMEKYHKNCGLSEEEWNLDKLADKIKNTESSLDCIGILRAELNKLNLANVSNPVCCRYCMHFFNGMGPNQGNKCYRDNITSLIGIDIDNYKCSSFIHKYGY